MKKLVGLLLLAVFAAAFSVGYLGAVNTASADPKNCTTTCDPVKCPIKCANQGLEGGCVRTGPNCYVCVCSIPQ